MNSPRAHDHATTEPLFGDGGTTSQAIKRVVTSQPRTAPRTPSPSSVDLTQPLVDADVIAGLLCVKRKRIYELARRPDDPLPSVRIGRAVRFVRTHVEEWVAHQAPH